MKRYFFSFCIVLIGVANYGQSGDADIKRLIRQKDSIFWKAYNTCDLNGMNALIAGDIEFYHDKGGSYFGPALAESIRKNLCGNENFRLRREEVAGSVELYTLKKNDSVYGVIMSGQHVFYVNEKGKKEFLDGLARFTHLWLLENGQWKMKRIFSFDHGPADRLNKNASK
jgi:hypothetical protein